MLTMEQIEAALYQKMTISEKLNEKQMERMEGVGGDLTMDREQQREHILKWFVETQAVLILCDGSFPPWFQGFISRHEAEDQLKDKNVGCFLIRLSEKSIAYILSYKGQDRCRHFVINQTKTGLFVVSGDSTTHNSLTELIDHFKTTPIQPFGEYLTSYDTDMDSVGEDAKNKLYDVVQNKPRVNAGVSVKALRSLWEQTSNVPHGTPPVLNSKSARKLAISTSIDRNSLSQGTKVPPVPKKNTRLRNSLSAGFPGTNTSQEQHSFSESRTSGRSEGYNSQLTLPLHDENNQSSTSNSCNIIPSTPQQPPLAPPKTASCSYAVLDLKKRHSGGGRVPYTDKETLQPNPLYQTSSVVCAGQQDQPGQEYDNRIKPIDNILLAENPYQDIPEQRDSNTYEHIAESNTYEDIRVTDSNTYASLDEMHPHSPSILGKKNHKWWKLRLENKKQ
ncbi:SH2 domain-containing protein 7-like [Sinocyclocheilus rhinocerous]|uniref:SH2 domain-containing protein 7-like n=1 Tax=Sinocyclocheilus rhinocerous TaxID=307959 RepID=UPI0007B8556E|nr:PREDICTED: SH2 domain-containing protein 7-like [Sinocyclocheilus rhinocerous]